MRISFTKMHGCGNDYIYINCFNQTIKSPETLSVKLSDRHKGIGADGIVLILPPETADTRSDESPDAKMRMFNADGSEGKMCGNAIRCVAKYLYDNAMALKPVIRIETLSGTKDIDVTVANGKVTSARVNMGAAILNPAKIPVAIPGEAVISYPLLMKGLEYRITCVSMGNPHAVLFCKEIDNLKLEAIGPLFERNNLFPQRINTEFIKVLGRNHLKMRVWERGSGETQACGTGACAAAVAAVLNGYCDKRKDIKVELPGGTLVINYSDEGVFLTGECKKVFDGTIDVRQKPSVFAYSI